MSLKTMKKEDLELMSYSEIAALILEESKKSMKIVDVFKKVCSLLEMSDAEFERKIADFFEMISTDKNFIVLEKGFCDLRKRHNIEVVLDDDEDEEVLDSESSEETDIEEDVTEENEDDIYYDSSSDEDDVDDSDDLDDFMVVDEDETSM